MNRTPTRSGLWGSLLLCAMLLCPPVAAEDFVTESERRVLNQVAQEIEYLLLLVNQAEQARNPDIRFPFDYPALQQDLELVRRGIVDHLAGPSRSPRRAPPLSGQYQ